MALGREIIDKEFRRYSLNYAKLLKSGEIKRVTTEFGFVSEDDLMASGRLWQALVQSDYRQADPRRKTGGAQGAQGKPASARSSTS